jgi:hypothetical protein
VEESPGKTPGSEATEPIGRELLGVHLDDGQQNTQLANRILIKLDNLGKRSRLESYVNQMSREERKYVSLLGILEEFRPTAID